MSKAAAIAVMFFNGENLFYETPTYISVFGLNGTGNYRFGFKPGYSDGTFGDPSLIKSVVVKEAVQEGHEPVLSDIAVDLEKMEVSFSYNIEGDQDVPRPNVGVAFEYEDINGNQYIAGIYLRGGSTPHLVDFNVVGLRGEDIQKVGDTWQVNTVVASGLFDFRIVPIFDNGYVPGMNFCDSIDLIEGAAAAAGSPYINDQKFVISNSTVYLQYSMKDSKLPFEFVVKYKMLNDKTFDIPVKFNFM